MTIDECFEHKKKTTEPIDIFKDLSAEDKAYAKGYVEGYTECFNMYVKNSEIVHCRDCTHWHKELSPDGKIEFFNFSHCELGYHGDGHSWYCPKGRRRDE